MTKQEPTSSLPHQQFKTILENCNVINVVTGDVLSDHCVFVGLDGRIARILPTTHDDLSTLVQAGQQLQVFDCQGGYVIPGLIDCHVHITAFTGNFAELERTSPTYVAVHAVHELKATLQRGITTIRDAGGADHGLARALQEGIISGPRLLFCGKALSQTGGHGDWGPSNEGPGESNYQIKVQNTVTVGIV